MPSLYTPPPSRLNLFAAVFGTTVVADSDAPIEFAGTTAVRIDRILPIESVFGLSADSVLQLEFLLSQAPPPLWIEWLAAASFDAPLPGEDAATQRRDPGTPLENQGSQRAGWSGSVEFVATVRIDPSVVDECLGTASVAVASDALAPIEIGVVLVADLEPTAEALQTGRAGSGTGLTAEALAARTQDTGGPIEWLGTRAIMIADAMLPLEWLETTPALLLSLESGPGRIRLLATPGRVRLMRRK